MNKGRVDNKKIGVSIVVIGVIIIIIAFSLVHILQTNAWKENDRNEKISHEAEKSEEPSVNDTSVDVSDNQTLDTLLDELQNLDDMLKGN